MIKSISYNQGEIIRNILTLHVPSKKIDLDCTYSKGNFYKGTGVEAPLLKFDINPVCDGVIRADARSLSVEDNSIGCMIFDPPFLSSKGPSLNIDVKRTNIIAKRFGTYSTERELHQFYTDALQEAHRILKENGILIFKCQDKVSSGKQYTAEETGQPMELRVYPGQDATFTLYEDDGTTTRYEQGQCSRIRLHWDDARRTLRIDQRQGSYEGMPRKRTFSVTLPGGESKTVKYNGKAKKVQF